MLSVFLRPPKRLALIGLCCLSCTVPGLAATQSAKLPVAPKWRPFERQFKSSVLYSNALQDVTLSVVFTSPIGETNQVYGFWDGSRNWKVRFSPYLPGRWTFRTTCSDNANKGLHEVSGQFLCVAPTSKTVFDQHGPVRVARDRHHFEHADGRPFLWFADRAGSGAQVLTPADWKTYARTRSQQRFTVVQWTAASGRDTKNQLPFAGTDRVAINTDFFKRLDAKLDALTEANLLSAIAPFGLEQSELTAQLPVAQAALMMRYMIARWGAYPVAWVIAPRDEAQISRWKTIAAALFQQEQLVVVSVQNMPGSMDELRAQPWIDAFEYKAANPLTDDSLKNIISGPLANLWASEPSRPLIACLSCENPVATDASNAVSAAELRRSMYWSLCLTPLAGVTYGTQELTHWAPPVSNRGKARGANLQAWEQALALPGAHEAARFIEFTRSIDYWRLRPTPGLVANQPGAQAPHRFIAAAATSDNDLSVIYVPEDRTLEIPLAALPRSGAIVWLNPRTGEKSAAVAVVGERSCQFPTPEAGDWLLLMQAGK